MKAQNSEYNTMGTDVNIYNEAPFNVIYKGMSGRSGYSHVFMKYSLYIT